MNHCHEPACLAHGTAARCPTCAVTRDPSMRRACCITTLAGERSVRATPDNNSVSASRHYSPVFGSRCFTFGQQLVAGCSTAVIRRAYT
jgi:hypothetical protein